MGRKTGQTGEQMINDGDVKKGLLPHIRRYIWYNLKKLEKVCSKIPDLRNYVFCGIVY